MVGDEGRIFDVEEERRRAPTFCFLFCVFLFSSLLLSSRVVGPATGVMAATPRKESSGTLNGFLAEMLNDLNNLVLDVPALPELPAEPSVPAAAAAAAAAAVPHLAPRKGMQRSPSMSSVRELLERCDSSFLNTSSPDDLGWSMLSSFLPGCQPQPLAFSFPTASWS
jgi:hypothetical protein